MINLPPSPFLGSPGRLDLLPVDKAVASSPPSCGAAADPIDEHRFVLDEERFLADIEPLPLFLQAPISVIEVLAGY